jgi:hypothetical protein
MSHDNYEPIWPLSDVEIEIDVEPTALSVSPTATLRRENPQVPGTKKHTRSGGYSSRGRNWSEEDSILLVQAYAWSDENKKGTIVELLRF